MWVCLYECMPCVCGCLWKPEEGRKTPGVRVVDSCELPSVDAENWTQILEKNSKCF